ncbi:MAG TPA: CpaF family protein [Acidimicrobiales bacterium]|nr:CpaF family protein [Acidimicrobiales bacterium]
MKLSEKLAVLEQRKRTSERPSSPAPGGARQKPQQAPAARAKPGAASPWDDTKRKVRDLVLAELAPKLAAGEPDAINDEVKSAIDRILEREDVKVSPRERQKFVQEMIQDTLGYGPLEPMLADESISEIMCNAFDDIWVERKGRLERVDVTFTDVAHYHQVIEKIVSGVGRRIDESAPMVDARLPDGSRVNAVIPPLAFHGAALTIRKFAADPLKVEDLVRFGAFSPELATVMEACVAGKLNILVSGGTGTGKTTNLNVLSSFIPEGERILTIEDAAELQLQQPHVVALEARPPNAEGAGEVKIRDLVRNALRMRPDRIIVGEVRGAEALDMLQAMNTGHEGSMTTVHSNSPRDAISRLETMVLMAGYDLPVRAIREQIVSALHVIMHLDRLPSGRRVVTSVTEVQGMEGDTILLQELFRFQPDQSPGAGPGAGTLVPTGLRPKFLDKLAETGVSLPMTALQAPGRGAAVPESPSRRMRLASGPRSR